MVSLQEVDERWKLADFDNIVTVLHQHGNDNDAIADAIAHDIKKLDGWTGPAGIAAKHAMDQTVQDIKKQAAQVLDIAQKLSHATDEIGAVINEVQSYKKTGIY